MADPLQGHPAVRPGSASAVEGPPKTRIEIPKEPKPLTKDDLPTVQAELDAWAARERAKIAARPEAVRSKKDDIHYVRCSTCYGPAIFLTQRYGPGKLPPLEHWYASYKPKGKVFFDGKPRCQLCGAGLRMVERNLKSISREKYREMVKEPSDG